MSAKRRISSARPPRGVARIDLDAGRSDLELRLSWSKRRRSLVVHWGLKTGDTIRWGSSEVALGQVLIDFGIDNEAVADAVRHHALNAAKDARWFSIAVKRALSASRKLIADLEAEREAKARDRSGADAEDPVADASYLNGGD